MDLTSIGLFKHTRDQKDEMIVVLFSQKISTIFDYYLSCCFRKQDILVRCYSSENAVAIKLCF